MNPFIEGTHVQWAWDSTALGTFKECARKYYYVMIRGFRSRGESPHLTFGIHYHSALEHYDKVRALGMDHEDALRETVKKVMLDTWVDREYEYYEKIPMSESQSGFLHHIRYGKNPVSDDGVVGIPVPDTGSAWESDHNLKTRANLLRSVVWYLEEFAHDPAKTIILANGQPAVELSFRFEVSPTLVLCGHLDRLVEWNEGTYVMDRKTSTTTLSSYYFDQYEPDNQMSLYTLAGRLVYNSPVRGVVIDAAQIAVGFTRFDRGLTYRTESQLYEWLEDTQHWIRIASEMAQDYGVRLEEDQRFPESAFPLNDKSCHKYGGCQFRHVCARSPEVRESFLQSDFEVRPWNPLIPRI